MYLHVLDRFSFAFNADNPDNVILQYREGVEMKNGKKANQAPHEFHPNSNRIIDSDI